MPVFTVVIVLVAHCIFVCTVFASVISFYNVTRLVN